MKIQSFANLGAAFSFPMRSFAHGFEFPQTFRNAFRKALRKTFRKTFRKTIRKARRAWPADLHQPLMRLQPTEQALFG